MKFATWKQHKKLEVEEIAKIISGWALLSVDELLASAQRVNETTGWTLEVRYEDYEYASADDATRVEGLVLGDRTLRLAVAMAAHNRDKWTIPS